jgi:hypothetical protein
LATWLRTKNESAADSLLEAFEELLTLHRLKVPALLRKSFMSTTPIESMFSLVRHSERNIKRTRGRAMLQRWLRPVFLYCEQQFKRVKGRDCSGHGEHRGGAADPFDEEGVVRKNHGSAQEISTNLLNTSHFEDVC